MNTIVLFLSLDHFMEDIGAIAGWHWTEDV